jgi:beta-phosphoglucomutase
MDLKIKAFIFDLDGVITDTAEMHYRSWKRLTQEEHIPFTRADNEQLRGLTRRASMEHILHGRSVDEATLRIWMSRKNAYFREYLAELSPEHVLPGVRLFLDNASTAGIALGLGSGSRNAREVLAALELLDYFQAVGDGLSVVNSKPAPDLFVWVAGALGVSPANSIVFEDATAGIEAAMRGGFWTVGVRSTLADVAHTVVTNFTGVTPDEIIARMSAIAAQTAPE